MHPDPYVALIQRIVDHDKQAFEEFYLRTRGHVLDIAMKCLPDRAAADEFVVDVFWQVWRDAPRFDSALGSSLSWLANLAHSRSVPAREFAEPSRVPATLKVSGCSSPRTAAPQLDVLAPW